MRLLVVHDAGDAESDAARRWAMQQDWDVASATPRDESANLETTDAVWIHGDAIPDLSADLAARLQEWTQEGGGVVLSLCAVACVRALGAGGPMPEVAEPAPWSDEDDPLWTPAFRDWPGYPHIRGLQGWGPHPIFAGLPHGAYTWAAIEGERVAGAVFRKPDWPDDDARVIAVERAYVHLGADVGVAWEYDVGQGRILCIGSHLRLTAPDQRFALHRDVILRNALADAAALKVGKHRGASRPHWPQARRRHASVGVLPRVRERASFSTEATMQPFVQIGAPDASAVTLAGARALVVGTESGGISEIWLHPMCVLSNWALEVDGEPAICRSATVTPGDVRREITTRVFTTLHEWIVVHPQLPEVHYQLERAAASEADSPLALQFRLPLRLEWPFPPDALVPLRVEVASAGEDHVVVVTGRDGEHLSALFVSGSDRPEILSEDDEGTLVRLRSSAVEGIRFTLTATTTARRGLPVPTRFADAFHAQQDRLTNLQQRTASLTTGDGLVDGAWTWAIARLGNFMAEGADGRGLMAGYAASRAGWGRSRPGYAWFFGRDSCWSVDAMLAAGMHDEARDAITLLVSTADITGKIAHEITTSGVVHYDAADSTPLLLRAVAAWAEWTGDLPQVRAWWPAVACALDLCVACDRDGDGLPENTGVGHGWVESGALGGGAVTSYTGAIWIDALRRLAPVAAAVGDGEMARRLAELERVARMGLEALRDPATGRLALHRRADGRLATDLTALAAVPIALGVDTSPSAQEILTALGSARFTTAWGLRMLPDDDPRYDPAGYHTGSVWPLFSGWAALADARCGAVDRAFDRMRGIAALTTRGCKGAFDEVLHGDTGAGAGVCPDQAWSAAMLIAPVLTGLCGVVAKAFAGECTLAPQLPRSLDSLAIGRLRVGGASLSIVCRRADGGDAVDVHVANTAGGAEVTVQLAQHRARLGAGDEMQVTLPGGR
jgi:glycogen debranching enzyme